MKRKRSPRSIWISAAMALLVIIAACGKQDEALPPVEIREGVDRCEVCHMLIADDRYATQLRLHDGETKLFDDLGDLFVWTAEHGLDDVNVRYVRDYHTEEWVQIEQATFVYDANFRTPMGYGVYSFKEKEDAEAFIAQEGAGVLLTYEDLLTHHWESTMDHNHDHDHHHDHDHEHKEHDHEHGHDHRPEEHDHDHGGEHQH